MVTTKKECQDAAKKVLKVNRKPTRELQKKYEKKLPPGCIYHKFFSLQKVLHSSYMNNHQELTVPCGHVEQSKTFNCICAAGKLLNFKEFKNQITKSSM